MFLYKYNKYTGKYYQYDMDFYDMFSPMFDDFLHPDHDNFEINYHMDPEYALTCAFCGTKFNTRTQLFKHLAYMGININKKKKNHVSSFTKRAETTLAAATVSHFNASKGDCGYFVKEQKQKDDMIRLCHAFEDLMCLD